MIFGLLFSNGGRAFHFIHGLLSLSLRWLLLVLFHGKFEKRRMSILHDGGNFNYILVIKRVTYFLRLLSLAFPLWRCDPRDDFLLRSSICIQLLPPKFHSVCSARWIPPGSDLLKMNVADLFQFWYSWCWHYRNDHGEIIRAEGHYISCDSSLHAKIISITLGIQYCMVHGIRAISIETDSSQLVAFLTRHNKLPWKYLVEIWVYLSSYYGGWIFGLSLLSGVQFSSRRLS